MIPPTHLSKKSQDITELSLTLHCQEIKNIDNQNLSFEDFYAKILALINKYCPLTMKVPNNKKFKPSAQYKTLLNKFNCLLNKHKNCPTNLNWKNFTKVRTEKNNFSSTLIKNNNAVFLIEKSKNDPKKHWNIWKNKIKCR